MRDGSRQLTVSTERAAPFAGAVMVDDTGAAASMLRNLSFDPTNMTTLRRIYAELIDGHTARSRADTLVIAELMALLTASRLFLFDRSRSVVLTFEPVPPASEGEWEDSESLAAEPEAPPAAAEPAPSRAVLAQAAALKQAAHSGSPFCEE
ncbi:MAG: hypothetical protein H6712_29010 [Myxococcales bacterium]|nr:hypothetical protein [Myxococcales bacterium]MCB9717924.1 hypothetical protein [Myxococcales bacterium]